MVNSVEKGLRKLPVGICFKLYTIGFTKASPAFTMCHKVIVNFMYNQFQNDWPRLHYVNLDWPGSCVFVRLNDQPFNTK